MSYEYRIDLPAIDLNTEEGFKEAFDRYFGRVFYYFRWRLNIQHDLAFDLTQETFLRVFKSRDTFRGESRLDTWIFQIAHHVGLNEIRGRKTKKREKTEVSLFDEEGFPPFQQIRQTFGFLPNFFRAQTLRADLIEPQMNFIGSVMVKEGS